MQMGNTLPNQHQEFSNQQNMYTLEDIQQAERVTAQGAAYPFDPSQMKFYKPEDIPMA
jgi:hypothetical protein